MEETEELTEEEKDILRVGLLNITEVNYGQHTPGFVEQAEKLYHKLCMSSTITLS